MCWINSQNVRDLRTPFGGVKASGIGREGGDYAFDFYSKPRSSTLRSAPTAFLDWAWTRTKHDLHGGRRVGEHPHLHRRPFDIVRAAFVELRVTDLVASERFYVELLGMIVSARTDNAIYLRGWEERQHHSLVLRQSPAAAASRLGFRVRLSGTSIFSPAISKESILRCVGARRVTIPGWVGQCVSGIRSGIRLSSFMRSSNLRLSISASTSTAERRSFASTT